MSAPMRLAGERTRCAACGEFFNSAAAFAKHRTGPFAPVNRPDTRRCLTVDEMTSKKMSRNSAGFWITSPRTQFTRLA